MNADNPAWRERFWRRFGQLQLGLLLFGIGISLMLGAEIGLDPWSSFHQGAATGIGISFGRVTQSVGLLLIAVAWWAFREKPGIGTVCNMAVIGPWIDLFRAQAWFPVADELAWGIPQFLGGMALVGLASGLYIGARLGAGPRDAFVLGLARRLGRSIRITRVGIEITVLAAGWWLGGGVGLGTLLFALGMGPLMQASLRVFGYLGPAAKGPEKTPDSPA